MVKVGSGSVITMDVSFADAVLPSHGRCWHGCAGRKARLGGALHSGSKKPLIITPLL